MPGRGDITAGRAFVELFVRQGAFTKGLADAQAKLRAFGAGLRTVGAGLLGVGVALAAPLAAALRHFDSVGSALADMSARTGKTVEWLAATGYAAEQTGASLEDLEAALRKSQKGGLDFDKVVERIAGITDTAERARVAMEAFGKSGTMLLPMIGQLAELRAEAVALGAPTSRDAELADQFGDALGRLKTIASNVTMAIGSALAPSAVEFLDSATEASRIVLKWVRDNGELIRTVAKVAAGLVVAGGAAVAIGTAIVGTTSVMGALSGAAGVLAGVIGLVANPAVLLVAALAGIGVGLYKAGVGARQLGGAFGWVGEQMGAFLNYSLGLFDDLSTTFGETWKGIVDAISAGDLQLAAEVAMAGLNLAWQQGTQGVNKLWEDAKWYFLTTWQEATTGIGKYFTSAWATLKTGWVEAMAFMESTWNSLWTKMAKPLGAFALMLNDTAYAFGKITKAERDLQRTAIVAGVRETIAGSAGGAGKEDEIQKAKADALAKIAKDEADALATLEADKQAAQDKTNTAYEKQIEDKKRAVELAKEELKLKVAAATGTAEGARMLRGEGFIKPPGGDGGSEKTAKTAGSFSAASLFAMGGGGGGPEKIAREQLGVLRDIDKNQKEIRDMEKARAMEAYA